MEYMDTFIYIMQFDLSFQYLYVWEREIFEDRIELRPEWWRILLWKLKILDIPYTKDMLDEGEQVMLSGAMRSIDAMKEASRMLQEDKQK